MIASFPQHCKILFLLLLLFAPSSLPAAEPPVVEKVDGISEEESLPLPILPTVTVEASRLDPLAGGTHLDREQIDKLPARNGNTSDLLRLLPGVQMPEAADSSKTAGEIAPAAVSIAGGRPYDNNFLIDGAGNNSLLDPWGDNTDIIGDVPGHPQEFFFYNDLISEITVLRSNISARYGEFTGGVIDLKTIDPADEFQGKINYRASDSKSTSFHINESQKDTFENSSTAENQPKFLKQQASTTLHIPITSEAGFVFHYSLSHSRIPLTNFGIREEQSRFSENLFGKFKGNFGTGKILSLSALYAPYTANFFIKNVKNSGYQEQSGGIGLTAKLENNGIFGDDEITLAYRNSTNSRRSPDNFLSWRNTASKNWGTSTISKEGGYGDIDKMQDSLQLNIHHQFNSIRLLRGLHQFAAGLDGQWTDAKYDRKNEMAIFSAKSDQNVDCGGNSTECVDNEQYFFLKTVYPKDSAHSNFFQAAVYVEDTMIIDRFTIRPGTRISWDDHLQNTNIAPRLAAAYDLFSNGNTLLIAGANRYYGENLLTMSLAQQKSPFSQYTRGLTANQLEQTWTLLQNGTVSSAQRADLKTPFSDEWTVGFQQKLWGGVFKSDYLERRGRDLLVTNKYDIDPDPVKAKYLKEWRNDGSSFHQEVNIGWKKSWDAQSVELHATWQRTRGNSSSYTDSFVDSSEDLDTPIWYNGVVGSKKDLLLPDHNRPFRASLIYTTKPLPRLGFTNITTYRSPYKTTINTKETRPYNGEELEVYEDFSNDAALIFDWHLSYKAFQRKTMKLSVTLDILNVFNQETNLGESVDDYEIGRQFWLGASCEF